MIRIAGIEKNSIVDGEGLRYVIFTQGCNHNCLGCHNPKSHDFNGGALVDEELLLEEILNDPIIDGITLSGGDPFFQACNLINLIKICKENELTVWAYTGFYFSEFLKYINKEPCDKRITNDMIDMLKYIDVVVDGPFILNQRTIDKDFVGSSNQTLVDVKKTLENNKIVVYNIE